MPILKYLDILIGLAVVMVLLSPAVTALTALWMWILNRRALHLVAAIADLIRQIDGNAPAPVITTDVAATLARAVMTHPMVANAPAFPFLKRLSGVRQFSGQVIERDELIRILLELAAGEGSGAQLIDAPTRTILLGVLAANGIADPGKTLSDIRAQAQVLERDKPELATHVRQTQAIIKAAQSDFVGKINNWFDQAMGRVSQRYATEARAVTVVAALLVALAVQIDSVDLIRRLSVDPTLRDSLLKEAQAQQDRLPKTDPAKPADATAGQPNSDEVEAIKAKRDEIDADLATLRSPSLAVLPDHFVWQRLPRATLYGADVSAEPHQTEYEFLTGGATYTVAPRWRTVPLEDVRDAIGNTGAGVSAAIGPCTGTVPSTATPACQALVLTAHRIGPIELRSTPGKASTNLLKPLASSSRWTTFVTALRQPSMMGVFLSWLLLSLGAPFWYDALKNLLKLRPAPAQAEEDHRVERAKQQPTPAPAPAKKA